MSLSPQTDNTMTGGCPECGREDGFVNDGRNHFFFCRTHRLLWYGGSNLFSSWRDESREEQAEQWRRVADYRDVTARQEKFALQKVRELELEQATPFDDRRAAEVDELRRMWAR